MNALGLCGGEDITVRARECVVCAPLCVHMWELELAAFSSIALLLTALRQSLPLKQKLAILCGLAGQRALGIMTESTLWGKDVYGSRVAGWGW